MPAEEVWVVVLVTTAGFMPEKGKFAEYSHDLYLKQFDMKQREKCIYLACPSQSPTPTWQALLVANGILLRCSPMHRQ